MLRKALDRIYYRSLARSVFEQYPGLARMRGVTQKQSRGRFQELDRKILKLHQQKSGGKIGSYADRSGNADTPAERLYRPCSNP